MTADIERRIARLEATHGVPDGMAERELSDEGKAILREILTQLHTPEEIERIVSAKALSSQTLSPASEQRLADARGDIPTSE